MRSFQGEHGKTAQWGGDGGAHFLLSEPGHSISSIEVRFGDKKNQYLQGLIVTLTDGAVTSLGTIKEKGQKSSKADFLLNETVTGITLFHFEHACGGCIIKTTGGDHKLGPCHGESIEMQLDHARLTGVWGKSGADIDSLGFIFVQPDEKFYVPQPLPEQRFSWKANEKLPVRVDSLHQPFQTVHSIDLSLEEEEIVGMCANFANKTKKEAGKCKESPDMNVQLPENALIMEAALRTSANGYMAGLDFKCDPEEPESDFSSEADVAVIWKVKGVQLMGLQCGWTSAGRIAALTLLFTRSCTKEVIGQFWAPAHLLQQFQKLQWNELLRSVFSYSSSDAILGIGFSFANGPDVINGVQAIENYASARFPDGATSFTVKSKSEPGEDNATTTAIQFDSPQTAAGRPWSAFLGQPVEGKGDQEVTFKGALIGAWGSAKDTHFKFGLISAFSPYLTLTCGQKDQGTFFETGSLYTLNHQEAMDPVVTIRSWWNKKLKCLNGLQIQRASGKNDKCFITDVGTFSGDYYKATIPEGYVVTEVVASIAPVKGGRVSGINIIGKKAQNRQQTFLIGELVGNLYHHEFTDGVRLFGLYGTSFPDHVASIGFVVGPT